jgi:hypothetical protein
LLPQQQQHRKQHLASCISKELLQCCQAGSVTGRQSALRHSATHLKSNTRTEPSADTDAKIPMPPQAMS